MQHQQYPQDLPRRLDASNSSYQPQYPSRNQSQHYQSLNAQAYSLHQQQYQQHSHPLHGISEEQFEEMEDRRRMQQQILRDKLAVAESKRQPDPNMTVQMTTSTGFAPGVFDMSESLAIVEDLLDYFGEDELDEFEGGERFNESQVIEAERTHQQRESIVRHLYDSEEDYLRSLQDIHTCYKKPLLLNLQAAEASKKTGLLGTSSGVKAVATKEEIDALFGNLDQLIEFHEDIRSLLEGRSKIWGPTQIMSDLLLTVIPRFKMYSKYYTNFHAALIVLDRISRAQQWRKFIEQCVAENPPGTPSLHLMLSYPLKRLSIYRDIVNSICQSTQTSHPDHANLMRAMDMINVVAGELKNERLMAQDQLTLWDIQSSMVGLPEPIMIPSRRLLLRADMHKCDSALALEPRTYYLMNDVLVYSRFDPKKNIHTFKGMFDLARTQINNPEDNVTLPQLPNCIQIANAGRTQMMRCRSREERNYWMETMRQAADIVTRSLDDPTPSGDGLPLRKYANSIASDSSSSLGQHTGMTSGSIKSAGRPFTDSRSINSKSSAESSTSKPRRPNPQADFYGCSFGVDVVPPSTEDNYRPSPLALSQAMSKNSSSSSVSTGATVSSTATSKPTLGAVLAAIPTEQLTPKQAKAKAALAAAVEARRQARLKQEAKNGGAPVRTEMNKNVNLDFSSSFIPAKERIAKSGA
ncbi:MAG: Dbl homology domain-containing protein [Linnemannia gamsii]|nr:MAG: Dbl homology domain-containing protein [Linnemannia gamsii]